MNKYITALFVSLLLSACGGGNDSLSTMSKVVVTIGDSEITTMSSPPSVPKVIVAIGDSETAGAVSTPTGFANIPEASYPARLQGLLGSKAVVHNLGVNSENLVEVWCNQFFAAVALQPDILIISTTLNDAGDNMDMELLRTLYSFMPQYYLPNTKIILLTPLKAHVSISPSVLQAYTNNLYASQGATIKVFDVGAYDTPEWYCGYEDFHPCEYGYREMARVVQEYLLVNNLI